MTEGPGSPSRGRRRVAAAVLIGGVLLAVGATTFPDPTATHLADRPLCLLCGDLGGTDLALNILLFMPLGAGIALWGGRARRAVVIGALLSLGIESLQLDLIPGRDASIRDLLANSLGAGLGALLAAHVRAMLRPSVRLARWLTLASATAALLVLAVGAWSMRPDLPYRVYWVQWQPVRPGYDAFGGTLLQLRLAGIEVGGGETLDPVRRPEVYVEEIPTADAVVLPGAPTRGFALIMRLVTAQAEAVMLGRHGHDLVYRFSIAGRHLGLRPPVYVLPGAFGELDGTRQIAVHGSVRDGRVLLRACDASSRCLTRTIPLSASRVWSLVAPTDIVGAQAILWLSMLFLFLLLLPLGYWSAWWGWAGTVMAVLVGVAGLAAVPWLLALPLALPDWIGVALGVGSGVLLARFLHRT